MKTYAYFIPVCPCNKGFVIGKGKLCRNCRQLGETNREKYLRQLRARKAAASQSSSG